jgi:acyl carrier protein
VELGELRAALNSHASVRDSVVVVRRGARGEEVLVGYYVSRQAMEEEELRRHMGERVLMETVPEVYVHLRKLPLTLNGKVDCKALAMMEDAGAKIARPYIGPRTEVEAVLAGFWREVLGVERVSVEDNFFGLGGHSLLATQIISRTREAFQVKLTLGNLFASPTLEGFAGVVEGALLEQADLTNLDDMLDLLEQMDEGEAEGLLVGEGSHP